MDALGQHGQVPEIPIQDGLVGLRLLFQGRPAHIIALLLREAHGKLGQRHSENGDLAAIWGQAHLMAVKGQPRLQPQGIPGAQARRLGPQLHQPVPQPGGVGAVDEQLIPQRFPGIAGLGNPHGLSFQLQGIQGVLHGLGNGLAAGHGQQQFLALWPLDGDGGIVRGNIRDGAVEILDQRPQMGQVLVLIGGVHHQQEPILLEFVQIGVVHSPAVFVGDDAILGLVQVQGHHVAGEHML